MVGLGLGSIAPPSSTFFPAEPNIFIPSSVPPCKQMIRPQYRCVQTSMTINIGTNIYGIRPFFQLSQNPTIYRPKARHGSPRLSVKATSMPGKTLKWWEKGLQSNMKEISSAENLATSLFNAGDQLVVLDFYSPGCGGCKALHPKICQIAEMNPDVQFLKINYEEHKSMCYSLHVHVLPFFRFYRGAQGRLCSFSCTNATIKKFRDALAKHATDRCSLGPARGLEESELALAANKDLSFHCRSKTSSFDPSPRSEETLFSISRSVAAKTSEGDADREVSLVIKR